jgi:hypothetical protein
MIFHDDFSMKALDAALNDTDAFKSLNQLGRMTSTFSSTHVLFHIVVNRNFEMTGLDLASHYVGLRLLEKYKLELIEDLARFDGVQRAIGGHLFEMYGHLVFSRGGVELKCKCLETGKESQIFLKEYHGARMPLCTKEIPIKMISGYYAATDRNFPAIDSMSEQGMFQFTISFDHPIRGVEIFDRLCGYYDEPKLYFVVPSHIFASFKAQEFKQMRGNKTAHSVQGLKQFAIELPAQRDFGPRITEEAKKYHPLAETTPEMQD